MSNTHKWWDDFWTKQAPAIAAFSDNQETWDYLVWKVVFEYWHDIFERHAPGLKMLECGCGSGKISQYMAKHGYQCTLLDYSEQAIQLAKFSFSSLSLDGTFFVGDMSQLCFRDGQFDIVFSGGVLEFFPDVQRPINEMVRVLKPGGIFSANMVPKKFSIQTIADIEQTLALSIRNLTRGRLKEAFKMVHSIPTDYCVSSLQLKDYVAICKKAGLENVVGLCTSPFPNLALPRFAAERYACFIRLLIPQWKKFNESTNRWKEIWGITYTIYGTKGSK